MNLFLILAVFCLHGVNCDRGLTDDEMTLSASELAALVKAHRQPHHSSQPKRKAAATPADGTNSFSSQNDPKTTNATSLVAAVVALQAILVIMYNVLFQLRSQRKNENTLVKPPQSQLDSSEGSSLRSRMVNIAKVFNSAFQPPDEDDESTFGTIMRLPVSVHSGASESGRSLASDSWEEGSSTIYSEADDESASYQSSVTTKFTKYQRRQSFSSSTATSAYSEYITEASEVSSR